MSALDEIKKNLGASSVKPLDSDINRKGTTQPVTQPKTTGSAVDAIRANLNSPTPAVPATKLTAENKGVFSSIKGGYDAYANQAERKVMSFNAGFVSSVGQLARSFQWLGDRIIGDRIVQKTSDKLLESELKNQDTLLKLYRERRGSGDTVGADRAMKLLKEASNNTIPYEAYADTTDSVFYKAQDKTQAWADVLKKSAGITSENSKFSDRLFEGAGSSATYFIPALGVFKFASVLAKVSPRIAMLFAGSANASLEAMAEAGSTFDEVKKTKGLQQAGEESTKVFLANAILLAVTNHLGIFNPDKLGLLKRALLSAPTEGLQEGVQQAIQNEATGRPIWEGVLESGAIGAIVGSVMGGVTDVVTTQTVEQNEGGKGTKKTTVSESPALTALRERLNVTPAIEAQKAIEQGSSTPLPSPTSTQGQNQGTEAVPVGQGSGLEADVRLPEVVAQQKKEELQEESEGKKTDDQNTFEIVEKNENGSTTGEVKTVVFETSRSGKEQVHVYLNNSKNENAGKGGAPEGKVWLETLSLQDAEKKYETTDKALLANRIVNGMSAKVEELKLDSLIKQPKKQKELAKEAEVSKNKTRSKKRKFEEGDKVYMKNEKGKRQATVISKVVPADEKSGTPELVLVAFSNGATKPVNTKNIALVEKNVATKNKEEGETKKQYPTIHEGGKIKMVEGEPVKIIDGIETFVHEGTGGYVVSEATTGRYLADSRTKEGAIAKAKFNIESVGQEKFIDLIKNNKLNTGEKVVSPKVRKISEAKDGEAIIVRGYHGTPDGRFLEEFDPEKKGYFKNAPELTPDNKTFIELFGDIRKGFRTGGKGSLDVGVYEGVSFTDDKTVAKSYSEKPAFDSDNSVPFVIERNLVLKKPRVIDVKSGEWDLPLEKTIENAKEEGYDSIVFKNIKDNYHPNTTKRPSNNVVVFSTESIKTDAELQKQPVAKEVKEELRLELQDKPEANSIPDREELEAVWKKANKKKPAVKKTGLNLEAQPEAKPTESRTQTTVAGEKVNRFTGRPQENENPRVIGQQKPLVTKTALKTILLTTPEFAQNPILTVEETDNGKVLSWSSKKTRFSIKGSALGLVEKNLQVGDQIRVSPETFKDTGQELRVIKYDEKTGAGSKYASVGRYRDDTAMFLGNPDAIKPIQFPELVGLAKELSGNTPFLRKYQKSNGMFYGKGTGEIGLNPELFKRENLGQLTKTLAHEIGHLIDYLPDQTLARGNLMGRLNTLRGFMKDFYQSAGQSRTNTELREQMYELSKYWRPYDEATASASFIQYRKSAPEIYADFISALFNDPRTVSSMAPTAYNVFFQQLDKKPAVKQAYFELQDLLRNGDVVANRRSATSEMFKVTEQESRERQIQNQIEQEMKEKSVWFKFKTEFVDITEVVKQDVKRAEKEGKYINPDDNPTYYLEERNYIGGKIKSEVETKFNTIYQELQKDNLTWEDLGELMFYERILKGDRQEIANPLGYQPDFVQELMEVYEDVGSVKPDQKAHEQGTSDMKAILGEDKFRKLQALAVEYRQNLKSFFEQGREEGIYSQELAKLFEENAFYVPFKGAKYSGVTRTTFGVKQQKGTLGSIENPANTGIEKAVSIIRAIERNRVTRKTIEFYQENFAEEVTEAPTDKSGQPLNPREEDLDLVTYMQDGKVKGFHVDKYIAEAIKKNTSGKQNQLIRGIRFFNSGLFRPLFITFNLGFQTFNLIRDFKRFWKNVPNMTILKAMKLYGQSARAGKIRAFGLPKNPSAKDIEANEFINRLENEKVISVTYNDIIKGENIEDAQIDRILRETGVRETKDTKLGLLGERIGVTKNTPIIKQAFQILDFIEKTGNMIETIPKVAGVKAIEGTMSPIEMRSFVRKYVGSPDFLAGGRDKKAVNEIFLFANAIAQGIRSDYEIATQPKSRGAYWLKTVQSELLPKLLMLMATAGLFGEALKELFRKVSEYDKANYTIIPLGEDENGKAIYFRMPSDESGRLIGGVFWKLATALSDTEKLAQLNTYTDLISYAGGQVPSVSPVVELGAFTLPTFLAGNNPYDFFRGRQVLTDEQQLAGGTERLKPFLSYMFQQLGGNVFMKLYYNETVPKNPSLSEKIVSLPVLSNIAGRFIKTSNYGEVEKVREVSNEIRSEKAREGIANRRVVFDYVDQSQGKSYGEIQALKKQMIQDIYGGFPKTPEDRTQARNLEKRFDTLRLRGNADAKLDALLTAQSNDEKVALLREYQKTMTPNEYDDLKRFIIKNRVVSSAVFQILNRVDK